MRTCLRHQKGTDGMSARAGWMAMVCAGVCAAADGSEPQRLGQFFARRVYWPWERTATNAATAGKELWQFTDDMMAFLQTNMSVNVIWFVNGPSDPGRACDLAARRGIKVFCGALTHQHIHGITGPAELTAAAQKLVPLKGNPGLGGYVLKDEPRAYEYEAEYMETLRQQMAQFDPGRDSIAVSFAARHGDLRAVYTLSDCLHGPVRFRRPALAQHREPDVNLAAHLPRERRGDERPGPRGR